MLFATTATAAGIKISEATYGCLCEPPANCTATPAVAELCDGKTSCTFDVKTSLCPKPPFPQGYNKLFVVFRCPGSDEVKSVTTSDGNKAAVSCQPATGTH